MSELDPFWTAYIGLRKNFLSGVAFKFQSFLLIHLTVKLYCKRLQWVLQIRELQIRRFLPYLP